MARGSWNSTGESAGDSPALLDAWSKYFAGWVTPIQVSGTLNQQTIHRVATTPEVYQLLPGSPALGGEYFLVENRQQSSYDSSLPGSGLLIWHIDESKTDNNSQCIPCIQSCSVNHYKVALVQADFFCDLETHDNVGDAGDPFPGASGTRDFDDTTYPGSSYYDGAVSGVSVTQISNSGSMMTATLSTGGSKAEILDPSPGAQLPGQSVTFTWSAGMGVTNYHLSVGSTTGAEDIYGAAQGSNLSRTISWLPTDGRTVYVRLWSRIASVWLHNDYTYVAASSSKAQMISPVPGSTLPSSTVTFTWDGGNGATQYHLYVGTTPQGQEVFSASLGTGLSKTISWMPTNGRTIYVTLWSRLGVGWQFNEYAYTAANLSKAEMVSPATGTTFGSPVVTFSWTAGTGATEFHLYVGTTAGGQELFSASLGAGLFKTISWMPTNGCTVYARLFSRLGGVWQFNDYSYTAATLVKARMTSPAPGSAFASSTVNFNWDAGVGVQEYHLYVGTSTGGQNIFSASLETAQSVTIPWMPQDGNTIYTRLWSRFGGVWQFNDYVYSAAPSVRAEILLPLPASALPSSTATFSWTSGTGVSEYHLNVGTSVGAQDIYSASLGTALEKTITWLPTNGTTIYVRLWSRISGSWQYHDYAYTAASL